MRLSRDDAFRIASDFEEWIHEQVGQDVTHIRQPDVFSTTVLRAKPRLRTPGPPITMKSGTTEK